ncbi:hypothetical protein D3C80_1270530 [compost metagenome]
MNRSGFEIHDLGAVALGVALEVNQNVDVVGTNCVCCFLIIHINDTNNITPDAAINLIEFQVVFRRVAEQCDFETLTVMAFEHVAQQLHCRMRVPQVVGKITNTDFFR